ncbi:MAG: hypothetical protein ABIA59_01680, partial [Candidatus Latescibacterota bacterium]
LAKGSNWIVPGDSFDTLVFTVTSTGSNPGQLDIRVNLKAVDLNNPGAGVLSAVRDTFVIVEEASGLFIDSTVAMVPNKQPNPPLAFVNTNQPYTMRVVVKNTGEAVKDVVLRLTSNSSSIIDPLVIGQYQPVGTDASATFIFNVTAGAAAVPFETFTASIDTAISVNSGLMVDPSPPVDAVEFITTQTRADLNLSLGVTWPAGAADNIISTSQEFDVTAVVANLGQAATDSSGTLRIFTDFALHPTTPNAVQSYYAGKQVTWRLIAPATEALGQNIVCAIVGTLIDKNIDAPAFVSRDTATVAVDVLPAGILDNPAVRFYSPPGAVDGVLSTGQELAMEVEVLTTTQTQGISASITLPTGFETIGSSTKTMGNGLNGTKTAYFNVIASSFSALDSIVIVFSATDANSGLAIADARASVPVEVVAKTRLRLSTEIAAPPEARDSTVTIGSLFTIRAIVGNDGVADISTLAANPAPVLKLTAPGGYTVNADSVYQRFALNTPVTWTVRAPSAPSGPVGISVVIDTVPADENSNQTAEVVVGQVTIPVQTEGAVVQVADASAVLGFDTKVVPAGATDVELFAIEIKNPRRNLAEPPAQIESVALTVLDGRGRTVTNPGATLAEVILQINGQRLVIPAPLANPIVLDVASMGAASFIQSRDSTYLEFSVSIKSNAALDEIRLAIESGDDIDVSDSASAQALGVVDKATGQPLADGLRSHPLVILSNQFSEYAHNYPNPFRAGNETTRIAYFLKNQSDVTIKIYSMAGNVVYEKVYSRGDPHTLPGAREAEWDGRNMKGETVRNGIYV